MRNAKAQPTEQNDQLREPEPVPLYEQPETGLTLNTLIRCLNGQVAPGLLIRMDNSEVIEPADLQDNEIAFGTHGITTDLTSTYPLPYSRDVFVSTDLSADRSIDLELPVRPNVGSRLCTIMLKPHSESIGSTLGKSRWLNEKALS